MKIDINYYDNSRKRIYISGEFSSWKVFHPLIEENKGYYHGIIDVQPGIYQYKLFIENQGWILDTCNPYIDKTSEFVNNTLVVGGTQPPLYFAPCRRCWILNDGILYIHAEVELGYNVPEHVNLYDKYNNIVSIVPLISKITIVNRQLIKFKAPIDERAQMASFDKYLGKWTLPSPSIDKTPKWLEKAVFYSIFVDRWHRSEKSIPDLRSSSRETPSSSSVFYGGDLLGIEDSLEWIHSLGIDAIILTPIYTSESPHRYDAIDFHLVDKRLGGEEALIKLIKKCHSLGVKIILDAAFTHCHSEHEIFKDLLTNQSKSIYCDWFFIEHFPVSVIDTSSYKYYPEHPELPLFNLDCNSVRKYFIKLIKKWIKLGIDGLRFDAVELTSPETWKIFSTCAKKCNPNILLIAECIYESPALITEMLDVHCATDYARYDFLINCFKKNQNDEALKQLKSREELLRHRLGPLLEKSALQFIDTHDTDRFVTHIKNEESLYGVLDHLFMQPEPILFYYGTEFKLTSGKKTQKFDSPWPDRMAMPSLQDTPFVLQVRNLIKRRKTLHSINTNK